MSSDVERFGLKFADWIWVVVVIATASVANMTAMYTISSGLQRDMIDLDRRWQDRTLQLTESLRAEVRMVSESIPPDWFRQMVESNSRRIEQLENKD